MTVSVGNKAGLQKQVNCISIFSDLVKMLKMKGVQARELRRARGGKVNGTLGMILKLL